MFLFEKKIRDTTPDETYIITLKVNANSEEDVEDWLVRNLIEEIGSVENMTWRIENANA